MNKRKRLLSHSFGITVISILMGFIVGAIILHRTGYNPFEAYGIMARGVFEKPKYFVQTVINSTPLILTGLSVVFAFRTGLFNIGAEGQFIIGALTAAWVGYFLKLPPVIHVVVVFFAAAIAAALWGGIAGFFKAKLGINEVITTIMLNWIALYTQNYFVTLESFKKPDSEASYAIQNTASIVILEGWKKSQAGREWLKNHPIWRDVLKTDFNWGFLIAILIAILIWYILNKTTLGYELRAVGFNRFAAEYGGISVKKSIVASMMIAGALAGAAGALHVMGVSHKVSTLATMEGYGFDGIAVSLIAGSSPIGCILAGLLFSGLKYGGSKIQYTMNAPPEIISIIIGVIVLFIAMPRLIDAIPKAVAKIMPFVSRRRGEKHVG